MNSASDSHHTAVQLLTFSKFITPSAIQLLFWGAMMGNLYGAWWLYSHDNWSWMAALVFGVPVIRIFFESLILRFRTYECLQDIRDALQ